MNTLGDIIRELRIKKGLEQKELANILKVHKGTISNWENNKRVPDNEMLLTMADFFGVSTDYLLGRIKKEEELKNKVSEEKASEILKAMEEIGIDIENIDMDILKIILESYKVLKKK